MSRLSTGANRMLAEDAHTLRIENSPIAAADVVAGEPTSGAVLLATHSGVELGIWEITSGVVTDIEADELFVVLSGRGRVEFDDGNALVLGPGSVVRLRAGDHTRWIVYETLRKIYVLLPDHIEKEVT